MDFLFSIISTYLMIDICNSIDLSTFCNGKTSGNHYHPEDCHKFLACVTGNPVPYQYDCQTNLVYDQSADRCDYRSENHKCTAEEVSSQRGTTEGYSEEQMSTLGGQSISTENVNTVPSTHQQSSTFLSLFIYVTTLYTTRKETTVTYQPTTTTHRSTATSDKLTTTTHRSTATSDKSTTTTHRSTATSDKLTTTSHQSAAVTHQQITTTISSTFAQSSEAHTTTSTTSTFTNTSLCECSCEYEMLMEYWRNETIQRLHWERLPYKLEEIRTVLRLNVSELTSRKMKKISAPDDRSSSQGMGVAGAILIAAVVTVIVFMDVSNYYKYKNASNLFK